MEDDTRTIILEGALKLFSRRGFDGVGIQEIADLAGITKPTLYYHFGNKQGLLEEIVRHYGGGLVEAFGAAAVYRRDLVMNLRALFLASLEKARRQPDFWRLMLSLFSSPLDSAPYEAGFGLRRSLLTILEDLFEKAAGDHGNMRGRHKIYGETFLGILETFSRLSINGELILDEPMRFRIIHQYMHGIFS